MVRVRDHVGGEGDGRVAVAHFHPLQSPGVAVAAVDPDARDDLFGPVDHVDVRSLERVEDLFRVARPLPRVGVPGRFEIGLLDVDPGVRVGRASVRRPDPAGVVEMEMGDDEVGDPVRIEAGFARRKVLDGEDVSEFLRPVSARPGVDEDRPFAHLDEDRSRGQGDPVVLVGGHDPRPDRLGHCPEHRPAVQAEKAVVAKAEPERAEGHHGE